MNQEHTPSIIPISSKSVQQVDSTIEECLRLLHLVTHAMESKEDFDLAHDGAVLTLNNTIHSLSEAKELLDKTGVTGTRNDFDFSAAPSAYLDGALADHEKTWTHLCFEIDRFVPSDSREKREAWKHLGTMGALLKQVAKAINRPEPGQPTPEDQEHEAPPTH